jgi:DNA-binding MarR family transcriptional regulator
VNETLAFYATRTVPGYPLGQPVDGRLRYGMTPEQAYIYRWLVAHRPHDKSFAINFRHMAQCMASTSGNAHQRVAALVERGWLEREDAGYRFVHPVMHFAEPRNG